MPVWCMNEMVIEFIDESLVVICKFLPYSIACNEYILILPFFSFNFLNIWYTYYHLLIGWFILIWFVIKISESSRDIDIPIDTIMGYVTTCLYYSGLLFSIYWLVVWWQSNCLAITTKYRAAIANIGQIDLFGS